MPGFGFGARAVARWRPPAHLLSATPCGRTAGYDAGTNGDYFVHGVGGLDTNPGTSPSAPFKTVGKAVATALNTAGSKTIRVMGDGLRYRERVSMIWSSGLPLTSLTLAAYGTDLPFISGAEVLSGFAPCTAADAPLVGANWPHVHRTTVPAALIAHTEYWRIMLSEAHVPLALAGVRETDAVPAFFIDATRPMFDGADHPGLAITTNPTNYATISHPEVLGAFSDAQLSGTVAALHVFPNLTAYVKVASVQAGTLTLAANSVRPAAGEGAYALLNVLPRIERGGWAYRENADATVTFFVWPNDPAQLAGGIEIAARKEAAFLYRAEGKSLTLDGLGFEMTSSTPTDFSSGTLFLTSATAAAVNAPTVVRQCHVRAFDGGPGLSFKFLNNVTFEDSTIETGRAFGMVCTPTTSGVYGYRIARVRGADISQTAFRCFGMRDSALVDCRSVRTSAGGHANSINFYQGCDRVAVVRWVGGYATSDRLYAGYATNQASSRLLFLNCVFPMANDGRSFVDQTGPSDALPGAANGDFAMVNCWTPHEPPLTGGGTPGFVLGRASGGLAWQAYNNVAPNISAGGAGNAIVRRNNLLTKASAVAADPSETVADYAAVHVDASGTNYAALAGGPLKAKAGYDVEALIAGWESWLPWVDFRRDALGRAWNPADPGVGPFGKSWSP